jgi:hypothetical protein
MTLQERIDRLKYRQIRLVHEAHKDNREHIARRYADLIDRLYFALRESRTPPVSEHPRIVRHIPAPKRRGGEWGHIFGVEEVTL